MVTRSVAASTHNTDKERPIIDDFTDGALDDLPRGALDGANDDFKDGANDGLLVVLLLLVPILIINVLNFPKFSTPRPVTGSHPGAAEKPSSQHTEGDRCRAQ